MKIRGNCIECGFLTNEYSDAWLSKDRDNSHEGNDAASQLVVSDADEHRDLGKSSMVVNDRRRQYEHVLVVCTSCGTLGARLRVGPKRNWSIPFAIAFILTSGIWVTRFLDIVLLVYLNVTVFVLAYLGYYLITGLLGNWNSDETCDKCGESALHPAFANLDRNLPCPRCKERSFRLSGTES